MRNSGKEKYKIFFHKTVEKDFKKINKTTARKIKAIIDTKIKTFPEVFGEPLRGTLKPHWKIRVEDYRIVYIIFNRKILIKVVAHRKDIYKIIKRRLGL